MRGRPGWNFTAFKRAADILRAKGHDVFNPADKGFESELPANPSQENTLAFRRKVFALDTEYICKHADAVALLPDWEQSRGAVAEKALADAVGLRVIYLGQEDGWHVAT
jgi:hypothetical protein